MEAQDSGQEKEKAKKEWAEEEPRHKANDFEEETRRWRQLKARGAYFGGAPKTPYTVTVTGAKFPTEPITGVISDQGFDAGTSDVEV